MFDNVCFFKLFFLCKTFHLFLKVFQQLLFISFKKQNDIFYLLSIIHLTYLTSTNSRTQSNLSIKTWFILSKGYPWIMGCTFISKWKHFSDNFHRFSQLTTIWKRSKTM